MIGPYTSWCIHWHWSYRLPKPKTSRTSLGTASPQCPAWHHIPCSGPVMMADGQQPWCRGWKLPGLLSHDLFTPPLLTIPAHAHQGFTLKATRVLTHSLTHTHTHSHTLHSIWRSIWQPQSQSLTVHSSCEEGTPFIQPSGSLESPVGFWSRFLRMKDLHSDGWYGTVAVLSLCSDTGYGWSTNHGTVPLGQLAHAEGPCRSSMWYTLLTHLHETKAHRRVLVRVNTLETLRSN